MTLYFISGLGIDRRVFSRLRLPEKYTLRYLDWIPPQRHETLPHYAERLAQEIDTGEAFSLIGLSFGGMIATEIAKRLSPKHTILVSSAATADELPTLYRLAGRLHLNRLVPPVLLKQPTPFTYWFFDAHIKDEKRLLKAILKDTDPAFLGWAIDSVVQWQNSVRPATVYHIHGDKDKVLPLQRVKADAVIEGGGHLVVVSHAAQVSRLIEERLQL